jgi:hypothetical protein
MLGNMPLCILLKVYTPAFFKNKSLKPQASWMMRKQWGRRWSLASVNFGGFPFFRQSHKVLDVGVMPVTNAYRKPKRDIKADRYGNEKVQTQVSLSGSQESGQRSTGKSCTLSGQIHM